MDNEHDPTSLPKPQDIVEVRFANAVTGLPLGTLRRQLGTVIRVREVRRDIGLNLEKYTMLVHALSARWRPRQPLARAATKAPIAIDANRRHRGEFEQLQYMPEVCAKWGSSCSLAAEAAHRMQALQEHQPPCWSVAVCGQDPTRADMFALLQYMSVSRLCARRGNL